MTSHYHAAMRRVLIVFLLVLLPLRGWTADVMALGQRLPTDTANHSLCPDHATAVPAEATDTVEQAGGDVHAHCTACQLPAMALPATLVMASALPTAPPAGPLVALLEPAPRRQIKPPIA